MDTGVDKRYLRPPKIPGQLKDGVKIKTGFEDDVFLIQCSRNSTLDQRSNKLTLRALKWVKYLFLLCQPNRKTVLFLLRNVNPTMLRNDIFLVQYGLQTGVEPVKKSSRRETKYTAF